MYRIARALFVVALLLFPAAAHAALTIEPLTWNVIGLDSNTPLSGPNEFPVGARVCSTTPTTNVNVTFVWDSLNAFVDFRPGSLSTLNFPVLNAGQCVDAYFEVEVTKTAAAFDTTRRYHITATDSSGTVSTPVPRELYVEHLISQSRNSISDVLYGTSPGTLTSVPAGGSLDLVVGNTYTIRLVGGTATQGYNQFEEFINFSNTLFQILNVTTTYSADNSPYVANPSNKLYADACQWENDPNSPNYRACVGGDFKAGGNSVVTTYTIKVISGGGTTEALNTLLYDFSGSSFHYNSDYGTSARIVTVSDPNLATIAKSFTPTAVPVNGVSTLTFTLGNLLNPGPLTGYAFVDNLPANLVVAAVPNATTSGCGTPSLTAAPGSGTISFSNGTVAANSTCVITVNVTPTATGSLNNTTNNLFVAGIDTGKTAQATLTVNNTPAPPAPICGVTMASWPVPGGSPNPPVATLGAQVAAASVSASVPADTQISVNGHLDTGAWQTYGYKNDNNTLLFTVDSTNYSNVQLTFWMANPSPANGPTSVTFEVSTNGGAFTPLAGTTITSPAQPFTQYTISLSSVTASASAPTPRTTTVRMTPTGANSDAQGASLNLDDIAFTGCVTPVRPTLTKSFAPDPIAVGATSTLTFTLTNTNGFALTGAAFTDGLPTGVQVAATPSAATTCGGTWAPTAGATALTFSGGTIPAAGSCTVAVNVTATTAGAHSNFSGNLSTTETGQTTTSVANDVLTAIAPPAISKSFDPSPILPGGISTLTFVIENPNSGFAQSGVAFSDTFPAGMVVAPVPNATISSGCGAPAFAPAASAPSVSFSGGTIAAGGTCVVIVDVTASSAGSYPNVTGNVSHIVNGQPANGNTAADTLTVDPPSPSLSLLKRVGPTNSGPWSPFLATTTGAPVFYRFLIENTGDVALTNIVISDNTLDVTACNAALSGFTLPAPVPANENHIFQCTVGPVTAVSGSHTNVASVNATFGATPVQPDSSTATYATTGLTLDKTATQANFTAAGDTLNYNYLVTNSGFAALQGPVTVTDDKTTVTCPAVSTVGDLDNFLEPGESITCTASYIVTAGDVTTTYVTNTATATVDEVNSNSDSATVTLVGVTLADVSLVKTLVTAGPYVAGQSISYTLAVTNLGPSTATNVQVTDTPANLTITGVSGGGCAALPCTIASLPVGPGVTINVTATIVAAGAFDNAASAFPAETDPNLTNNTDSAGNGGTAAASADVRLIKTLVTAGPYVAGQSISYTLAVDNLGPSTATNVQVTDTPTNLTITSVSGGGCAALPCTIPSLPVGPGVTINVTATIVAAGAFDNSATALGAENDPNLTNNTDNAGNGGTAAASADVRLVKTLVTSGPFVAGQSISYTLAVDNLGPSTATNVQVTDTPTNLTITSVSGGGCAALPCTIASLPVGPGVTINVTATIVAAGGFDNTATALAAENDPNLTNNTDSAGNGGTAAPSADVRLVKTLVTSGPFSPGQSISYTLTVDNLGPSTATSVQVTDTPTNLTITSVSGGGCAALPCTIASLPTGPGVVINVTATIDAAGAFDNTATALAMENDPNLTNNTDSVGNGGTAALSADVRFVKTLVTSGPYSAGQSISYTLAVDNLGPSTATNVQVTDTPTNLTITSVSGGGCAALPCTIASLPVGPGVTINVTATIVAAGGFDNSATALPAENDPNLTNNTDNTGNGGEAAPSADVRLVKTLVTAGPYSAGQSIGYTLAVTNLGPSTATNVQVTDTPTNLTITSVSGGGCAALPCTIASLPTGPGVTINVTATIVAAGAFDNAATALGAEPDPNLTNNTDNTGNGGIAAPSADVSIVKTLLTAGPYLAGQSLSYTLVVANAGPSTATNVQVTDTPTNLTITGVSGACAALPCTIASLPAGPGVTINVTATIVAPGAFDNVATATAAEPDPNPTNNTDSDGNGGLTGVSADVRLVKTLVTAGPFVPGQSVSYTLVVTNNGPSPATNVQVTDTPTNLTITAVSGGCAALPCTIANLPVGGPGVTINVTATIVASGAFDNAAAAAGAEPDPNNTNNTDSSGNGGVAAASADVRMIKTLITGGPFAPGQSVSYTLVVNNFGPSTATTVQVTDTPSNLTITGVSGACAALPCTIASIASGASVTINVTATIVAAGAFDNSATAIGVETDPNLVNNTDPSGNGGTAVAPPSSADVRVTKSISGPIVVGQPFDYTIAVVNNGPSTATNVTVTDVLPAGFSLISATSTQGTCSGTTTVTCTVGTMALNATATITIRGTATQPGSYANTATVAATQPDPVPTNNTSTIEVSTAVGIPTLDFYALAALALLLAVAGVLMRR